MVHKMQISQPDQRDSEGLHKICHNFWIKGRNYTTNFLTDIVGICYIIINQY